MISTVQRRKMQQQQEQLANIYYFTKFIPFGFHKLTS